MARVLGFFADLVGFHGIAFGAEGAAPTPVDRTHGLPVMSPDGFFTSSVSFARPADNTAYLIYDLVGNSVTAGSVLIEFTNVARAAGEAIRLERLRMRKSNPTLTNASFRIHLFRTQPLPTVGDNGIFNASGANTLALTDIAGRIGEIDITMDRAGTAGAQGIGVPSVGSAITCETPSPGVAGHETSLWALVEARAAYGGAAANGETFVLTLEGARS